MLFITQQLDYACEHATRAGNDARVQVTQLVWGDLFRLTF